MRRGGSSVRIRHLCPTKSSKRPFPSPSRKTRPYRLILLSNILITFSSVFSKRGQVGRSTCPINGCVHMNLHSEKLRLFIQLNNAKWELFLFYLQMLSFCYRFASYTKYFFSSAKSYIANSGFLALINVFAKKP
jgi:hypothetical protein